MIGQTVSHYRILEKIGEGGMGEVYRAEDQKLHRDVAVKFLPEELTRDEERRARFQQEARAAAGIDHPHIGAVFDIDEVDGRLFIVMEYIRGKSLRALMNEGPLSLSRCLELAGPIASALAKAHERGIVHRDLKPDNVIVSEDGYPKVIDFGLSKLLEPLHQNALAAEPGDTEQETVVKTRDGIVLGTATYMSPEQARGEEVDARTDVFSFGVVLYELLTRTSPFRRATPIDTLNAVLNDEPPLPSFDDAPSAHELQRILRKALNKDRDHRYQSMKDVAIDLDDIHKELQSAERTAVLAAPAAKRNRAGLVAGAVGVVALSVLGLFALRDDPAPSAIGASGRPAIAVLYFEDHSGDEEIRWLSQGLPSMLLTGLAQTPGLDVVSSQRIHEILDDLHQENLEAIDRAVASEVARRSGAGAIVVGSIFKSGDQIQIDVQVEDIGSGRVLSADSVRGSDVFPLVDELTGRIRTSLAFREQEDTRSISEITTSSLEAYRLYSEGLEARRNLRYIDARRLFEEAVAADPGFAMAYFELSRLARVWRDSELAARYRETVLEHLDRLPERERLLVQARYAERVELDDEKASRYLEELMERYPDEEDAYIAYALIHHVESATFERGVEALSRAVREIPTSGALRNMYGYTLISQDRYRDALAQFEAYAELAPTEPNPYDSQGEVHLLLGQPERAIERYARALENDPTFLSSHAGRAWGFAMMGRYDQLEREQDAILDIATAAELPFSTIHFMRAFGDSRLGRYRSAAESLSEGIALTEQSSDHRRHAVYLRLSAMLSIETGRFDEARRDAEQSFAEASAIADDDVRNGLQVGAHTALGLAAVRAGDIDAAKRALQAATASFVPSSSLQTLMVQSLRAEILLAEGNLREAEEAFLEALPRGKMLFSIGRPEPSVIVNHHPSRDLVARVHIARGELREAVETYRALNTPSPESKWTSWLEPRYVLEEARLYERLEESEAAGRAYERFLELWKDADPDRPELAEARAYLASSARAH